MGVDRNKHETYMQRRGFFEDDYVYAVIPDMVCVTEEEFDAAARKPTLEKSGAIHWGETVYWHLYGAWK